MASISIAQAGCCPTDSGICCSGPCQYECSNQSEQDIQSEIDLFAIEIEDENVFTEEIRCSKNQKD